MTAAKKPDTLKLERWALNRWKEHLGDIRIDRIDASAIAALRDKRLRAGTHPRTVTRRDATAAAFDSIETFDHRVRLHSALGFQSPADFENQLN